VPGCPVTILALVHPSVSLLTHLVDFLGCVAISFLFFQKWLRDPSAGCLSRRQALPPTARGFLPGDRAEGGRHLVPSVAAPSCVHTPTTVFSVDCPPRCDTLREPRRACPCVGGLLFSVVFSFSVKIKSTSWFFFFFFFLIETQ
jgi:hypothetical protein